MAEKAKRKPFIIWKIGEEEYRLKLTTGEISRLEQMYGGSLINLLNTETGMTPLCTMLDITHGGLQKFNSNIDRSDVNDMFDRYIDEGGSQTEFLSDILIPLFQVSGFFSGALETKMEKEMAEAKKNL